VKNPHLSLRKRTVSPQTDGRKGAGTWLAVIEAALIYFAAVFLCAFLIGIFRVLVLAPALGRTGAVLVELPPVLAISWRVSSILTRWFGIRNVSQRLAMGGFAFVVTMAAEAGLSAFAFGQPVSVYARSVWNLAGMLGLSGQLGFALIPAIQLVVRACGSDRAGQTAPKGNRTSVSALRGPRPDR
jgi:hypothetical protein